VEDAARGELKEIYSPVDAVRAGTQAEFGRLPMIPWDSIDLRAIQPDSGLLPSHHAALRVEWETFHIIRLNPDAAALMDANSARSRVSLATRSGFRSNRSIVEEMLKLLLRWPD